MTIKFHQFKKNSHAFDVMPNNFRCTDYGDLIVVAVCTHSISRKSHERAAPYAEQNFFTDSKTELGFYPKSNTRVKRILMFTFKVIDSAF